MEMVTTETVEDGSDGQDDDEGSNLYSQYQLGSSIKAEKNTIKLYFIF